MRKCVLLILIISFLCSVRLQGQIAGITNPSDGLIIDKYRFSTYIIGSGYDMRFDGYAGSGNNLIKLYVNGAVKLVDCISCGTWYTTQTADPGLNNIYLESAISVNSGSRAINSRRSFHYVRPMMRVVLIRI